MKPEARIFLLLALFCGPGASGLGPASAEVPPGASALQLPIRLDSKFMAPADLREKDGRLGTLTAYVRHGRIESSERARVHLRVDGVTVTVEFEVHSIEHPERLLGYSGVTHEYQMRLLRFQHGYRRSERDGAYTWDDDSEESHHNLQPIQDTTGKELDAFLQRSVELWVDRALSMILLNLEQDFRTSSTARQP